MRIKFFHIVLLIPIINVIANITTNYYDAGTINPGFYRMVYMIFVTLFVFVNYKIKHRPLFAIIILFLFYNLILVLFNDEIRKPLITFVRLALPVLMLPIGYTVINSKVKLNRLIKICIIALALLAVNYLIANVFRLGHSVYLEDSFYIGGAQAGDASEIALLMLIAISFVINSYKYDKRWTRFSLVLAVVSLVIILLVMRRSAILVLVAGLFTMLFFSYRKWKLVKYISVLALIMILLFPLYGETLTTRYKHRAKSREGSLANYQVESRYKEIWWVLEDLQGSGVSRVLFGTHNLNSARYFEKTRNWYRELHIGYTAIIHGSGIVGLLLFFLIINTYRKKVMKLCKLNHDSQYVIQTKTLSYVLILSLLVYLLTNRLHGFILTTPAFLLLGGVLGFLNNSININDQRHVNQT